MNLRDEAGTAVTDKSFHVSPFFDVSGTYELRFTLRPDLVATTVTLRRPVKPMPVRGSTMCE